MHMFYFHVSNHHTIQRVIIEEKKKSKVIDGLFHLQDVCKLTKTQIKITKDCDQFIHHNNQSLLGVGATTNQKYFFC